MEIPSGGNGRIGTGLRRCAGTCATGTEESHVSTGFGRYVAGEEWVLALVKTDADTQRPANVGNPNVQPLVRIDENTLAMCRACVSAGDIISAPVNKTNSWEPPVRIGGTTVVMCRACGSTGDIISTRVDETLRLMNPPQLSFR